MQKRFTPDEGGVFPEWEEVTLGKIAEFSRGKGLTKKDVAENGKKKCLLYGQLQVKYGTIIKNVTGMTDAEIKNPVLSKAGDVLISGTISAGLAKASCIKEDGVIIGGDINILRPKEGIDGEFLARVINANTKKFKRFLEGSVILHLKNENIKEISIKIPKSIEEQRKIAVALAAYDEMIAVKTAKLEVWQECKKRMVKEIFGRTKRFMDDDGKEFPEWEEKTLGKVTEYVRNGYSYKPDGVRTHKYKVTRIETISTGKINPEKLGSCEECDEKYLLKFGDILYSNINSLSYLGNTAIYKNSSEKIYHGMNLLCIRPKSNDIDADYLFAFLNSETARKFVKYNAQRAVNQCSIKVSDVRNMRIPLPCMEEQQKIGSFLAEIDKEIQVQKEFIKTYAEGKKRMMRELVE